MSSRDEMSIRPGRWPQRCRLAAGRPALTSRWRPGRLAIADGATTSIAAPQRRPFSRRRRPCGPTPAAWIAAPAFGQAESLRGQLQ